MKKNILIVIFLAAAMSMSCARGQKTETVNSYYTYPVEVIGTELDGSVTLRSWGTGRNRSDAVEQAHKNAVYAILFKGVQVKNQAPTMSRPLILENNAEQKYQYFFNRFFADSGPYSKFISREDTRGGSNTKEKSSAQRKYGVTVRVLRSELRQYLIDEGIIKP